jgi:hypothetical protein
MSLSAAMGVVSVVLCAAAGAALLLPRMQSTPSAPKRLLVAVDGRTGAERALDVLADERLCATVSTAPAWPALYGLQTGERLECRAQK